MSEKTIHIGPSVLIIEAIDCVIMEANAPSTAKDGDRWHNTTDGWDYEYENGEWHRRSKTTGIPGFTVRTENVGSPVSPVEFIDIQFKGMDED